MGTETPEGGNEIDTNRGIENAQSRFLRHSEGRTTQSQLRGSAIGGDGSHERITDAEARMNAREEDARKANALRANRRAGTRRVSEDGRQRPRKGDANDVQRVHQNVKEIFNKEGEKISDEEIEEISGSGEEKADEPRFPYFIFTIALIKDMIDVVATATIVGAILTPATSFLCSLILFIWTLGKISGWMGRKKKIITKVLIKFFCMFGVELVPGLNIIPTTTIYVLMAHYDESKIVKLINLAIDELH